MLTPQSVLKTTTSASMTSHTTARVTLVTMASGATSLTTTVIQPAKWVRHHVVPHSPRNSFSLSAQNCFVFLMHLNNHNLSSVCACVKIANRVTQNVFPNNRNVFCAVTKLEEYLENPSLAENQAYLEQYMDGVPEADRLTVGAALQQVWDDSLIWYYPRENYQFVRGEETFITTGVSTSVTRRRFLDVSVKM